MTDYNTRCKKCNKVLVRDEIAIYLRLVNRGAKEYLCIPCLAEYFKCSEQDIHDRIKRLKDMGCTLFS
jgi:biotin operon repressor